MRITRANYEVYFVDYFDGRLSQEAKEELMRFLEAHPDLKEEFYNFDENVILQADSDITFPKKDSLKKQETARAKPDPENYESWFIAYAEGDLNREEQQQVERFVHDNPALKQEFLIYQKLSLKADSRIRYPDKKRLKKKSRRKRTLLARYAGYAAAAGILLFAGLFWLIRQEAPGRQEENISQLPHYEAEAISGNPTPNEQAPKLIRHNADEAITEPLFSKDRNQMERLTKMEPLTEKKININNCSITNISPRYEQTSEYYYQTVMKDLEYLEALSEYKEKTLPGKLFYRLKNAIAPPEDYYVISEGFSPLKLLGITSKSFGEVATNTLPENITIENDHSNTKKYGIKTGIFEITHKRTLEEDQ